MEMILTIIGCVLWSSICEWILHRYMMHNCFMGFRYPYDAHAKVHHVVFKSDETYHCLNDNDKETIPMAWWNGVVIALIASIPMCVFGYWVMGVSFVVSLCYYGVYEILHWYMHLPKQRGVEYVGWYRRLNGHHILHHRYVNRNYNVVLPFADLILGTLLLRSPIKFNQVKESYCVPDLQPK